MHKGRDNINIRGNNRKSMPRSDYSYGPGKRDKILTNPGWQKKVPGPGIRTGRCQNGSQQLPLGSRGKGESACFFNQRDKLSIKHPGTEESNGELLDHGGVAQSFLKKLENSFQITENNPAHSFSRRNITYCSDTEFQTFDCLETGEVRTSKLIEVNDEFDIEIEGLYGLQEEETNLAFGISPPSTLDQKKGHSLPVLPHKAGELHGNVNPILETENHYGNGVFAKAGKKSQKIKSENVSNFSDNVENGDSSESYPYATSEKKIALPIQQPHKRRPSSDLSAGISTAAVVLQASKILKPHVKKIRCAEHQPEEAKDSNIATDVMNNVTQEEIALEDTEHVPEGQFKVEENVDFASKSAQFQAPTTGKVGLLLLNDPLIYQSNDTSAVIAKQNNLNQRFSARLRKMQAQPKTLALSSKVSSLVKLDAPFQRPSPKTSSSSLTVESPIRLKSSFSGDKISTPGNQLNSLCGNRHQHASWCIKISLEAFNDVVIRERYERMRRKMRKLENYLEICEDMYFGKLLNVRNDNDYSLSTGFHSMSRGVGMHGSRQLANGDLASWSLPSHTTSDAMPSPKNITIDRLNCNDPLPVNQGLYAWDPTFVLFRNLVMLCNESLNLDETFEAVKRHNECFQQLAQIEPAESSCVNPDAYHFLTRDFTVSALENTNRFGRTHSFGMDRHASSEDSFDLSSPRKSAGGLASSADSCEESLDDSGNIYRNSGKSNPSPSAVVAPVKVPQSNSGNGKNEESSLKLTKLFANMQHSRDAQLNSASAVHSSSGKKPSSKFATGDVKSTHSTTPGDSSVINQRSQSHGYKPSENFSENLTSTLSSSSASKAFSMAEDSSSLNEEKLRIASNASASFKRKSPNVYPRLSPLEVLISPLLKPETIDTWAPKEVCIFEAAVCKYGKDFNAIHKLIRTKSVKETIEFYYLWKKSSRYAAWKEYRSLSDTIYGCGL